ncbi:hypothetical protein HJFPF1_12647 [Paramyrothecium foliicola]|nr:hypothetical protein HJFPF1_12647 [Paramyrothecium foliicola]
MDLDGPSKCYGTLILVRMYAETNHIKGLVSEEQNNLPRLFIMSDRPTFDGSGKGGDAKPTAGRWSGGTGTMTGGAGTGGDVSIGGGRQVPNANFKVSGTGGDAQANAGGGARGGDGKGGSFNFS